MEDIFDIPMTEEMMQECRDVLSVIAAQCKGEFGNRKGPGRIVETSSGKGRTYNSEPLINGKIPVFISGGQKILCKPENIKFIGFID